MPDKVLIDTNLENWEAFAKSNWVKRKNVLVLETKASQKQLMFQIESDLIWYEEFLDYKIVIGTTNSDQEAIEK
jgi:glutamate-5-semialdehyde dehydrogenase